MVPRKKKKAARKATKKTASKPAKRKKTAQKTPLVDKIPANLSDDEKYPFLERIRHPKKRAFLKGIAEHFNIRKTARLTGIHVSSHYEWKAKDPDYLAASEVAAEIGSDHLEAEMTRRAMDGLRQYKFYKGDYIVVPCAADDPERSVVLGELPDGKIVYGKPYYELEFSDTVGIFLLKGAKPEKYRDRYEVRESDDEIVEAIIRTAQQAVRGPQAIGPPEDAATAGSE